MHDESNRSPERPLSQQRTLGPSQHFDAVEIKSPGERASKRITPRGGHRGIVDINTGCGSVPVSDASNDEVRIETRRGDRIEIELDSRSQRTDLIHALDARHFHRLLCPDNHTDRDPIGQLFTARGSDHDLFESEGREAGPALGIGLWERYGR